MTKIDKLILQGSVDLDDLEDRDSYEFSFHEVKAALAMLRQQQEKLNKYELRNMAQCDRIAILEAQLRKAQEQ